MTREHPFVCTNPNRFVQRIFALINETELTLVEIANAADIHVSNLHMWPRNRINPRIHHIEAVLNVLGRTLIDRKQE